MKKNLVLLHGAIGSTAYFQPIIPLLKDQYNVHTFNFDGHGGEPSKSSFSIDLFVENTRNFLHKNQLKKVNIFGYSMGGFVALKLAKQHPELVEQIITLATKFDWNVESAAREVKMLNPEKIELKVPAFAETLKKRHAPLDWKTNMSKTAEMMLNLGENNALNDADFKQIKNSVSIGVGSADKMVSVSESEHIANLLPNGTFTCLTGLPHPIDQVDPKTIANYIQQSLK